MPADLWRLLRRNAAARRYARVLPNRLGQDYGAGEYYTAAQIRSAVMRAGLPMDFLPLGYAAFLDEATFLALDETRSGEDYCHLRAVLRRFVPVRATASGFKPCSDWMYCGDNGSRGGGGSGG